MKLGLSMRAGWVIGPAISLKAIAVWTCRRRRKSCIIAPGASGLHAAANIMARWKNHECVCHGVKVLEIKGEVVIIMHRIKLVALLILSLTLVLLVVQNTAPMQAHFLWLTAEVPVILLLFLAAVGGFVSGLLIAVLIKKDAKKNRRENYYDES